MVNIMTLQTKLAALEPLTRAKMDELFNGCVDEVAMNLVGMFIASEANGFLVGGQIIETEAYCENDPAAHCHANARPPLRQIQGKAMKNPAGHIYVYPSRVYDKKGTWCLNLTCGSSNHGSAVLLRALWPTADSVKAMKAYRSSSPDAPKVLTEFNLCNGPGILHEALGLIGDKYNEEHICQTSLKLFARVDKVTVNCGRRVNLRLDNEAAKWPRSYILQDDAAVRFLSPDAKTISNMCGRQSYPPQKLHELKTDGLLAKCQCLLASKI